MKKRKYNFWGFKFYYDMKCIPYLYQDIGLCFRDGTDLIKISPEKVEGRERGVIV